MRPDENRESFVARRRGTTRFLEDVSARSSGAARVVPTTPRERFVPSAHILKHLPVGLAVQRGGRLIRVNQRLLDLLGYTREVQLVGRPVLELITPEDWPSALAQIQRAAFRRGDGGTELLRFSRSDGAPVPLWVTLALQSDGELPVVIATCIAGDAMQPATDAPPDPEAGQAAPTLLEVAAAIDDVADSDDEAVATLQHLLETGRVKRRT